MSFCSQHRTKSSQEKATNGPLVTNTMSLQYSYLTLLGHMAPVITQFMEKSRLPAIFFNPPSGPFPPLFVASMLLAGATTPQASVLGHFLPFSSCSKLFFG